MAHTVTRCNKLKPTPNTLQHTATQCNTLQHSAAHCRTLQRTTTHCNTQVLLHHPRPKISPTHIATHSNKLKTLQHTGTRCNTLQHAATHGNTRQHIATRCNTQVPLHHPQPILKKVFSKIDNTVPSTYYLDLPETLDSPGLYVMCVAACCSVLQCVALWCSVLQYVAVCFAVF